jgi:hypothetical protein
MDLRQLGFGRVHRAGAPVLAACLASCAVGHIGDPPGTPPPDPNGVLPIGADQFCGDLRHPTFAVLPEGLGPIQSKPGSPLWLSARDQLQPVWDVLDVGSSASLSCGQSNVSFVINVCHVPNFGSPVGNAVEHELCSPVQTCSNRTPPVSADIPSPRVDPLETPVPAIAKIAVLSCSSMNQSCTRVKDVNGQPVALTYPQGCLTMQGGDFAFIADHSPMIADLGDTHIVLAAESSEFPDFGSKPPDRNNGQPVGAELSVLTITPGSPRIDPTRYELLPLAVHACPSGGGCTDNRAELRADQINWDENFSSSVRVSAVRVYDGPQPGAVQVPFCFAKADGVGLTSTTCAAGQCVAELGPSHVTPAYQVDANNQFLEKISTWTVIFNTNPPANTCSAPNPDPASKLYVEFELSAQ